MLQFGTINIHLVFYTGSRKVGSKFLLFLIKKVSYLMTEVIFHLVKFFAILDQIEERKHLFIFFTTTKNSYLTLIHSACTVV